MKLDEDLQGVLSLLTSSDTFATTPQEKAAMVEVILSIVQTLRNIDSHLYGTEEQMRNLNMNAQYWTNSAGR